MSEATGKVVQGDKEFEDAFAEAAADAEKGDVTKAPAAAVEPPAPQKTQAELDAEAAAQKKTDDEAAAAQVIADKKAADEAAIAALSPEERTKKEADDKAAADEAARVKKDADDAAARVTAKAEADAKAKKDAEDEAARKAAEVETPEAKKIREDFEQSIAPYEPTAEEKTALEKFKVDFPNEAAAVEARLKSVDRTINAKVHQALQAVIGHINPRMSVMEQLTEQIGRQSHLDALHKAHPDYDAVIGKVPAWIKTQPALLQPTLQAAYDEGDTQSVLDLVVMFKAANPAAGQTAEQIAAVQKKADEAAAAKKKLDDEAAALATVSGKRTNTQPRGSKDPNNFDEAFDEAAQAAEDAAKKK